MLPAQWRFATSYTSRTHWHDGTLQWLHARSQGRTPPDEPIESSASSRLSNRDPPVEALWKPCRSRGRKSRDAALVVIEGFFFSRYKSHHSHWPRLGLRAHTFVSSKRARKDPHGGPWFRQLRSTAADCLQRERDDAGVSEIARSGRRLHCRQPVCAMSSSARPPVPSTLPSFLSHPKPQGHFLIFGVGVGLAWGCPRWTLRWAAPARRGWPRQIFCPHPQPTRYLPSRAYCLSPPLDGGPLWAREITRPRMVDFLGFRCLGVPR